MPATRLRAMLAEAALQGATLSLFSAAGCVRDRGSIMAEQWTPHGFVTQAMKIPDVILVITASRDPSHERTAEWLMQHTAMIIDCAPDKLALAERLIDTHLGHYVIPFAPLSLDRLSQQLADWLPRNGASVVKSAEGKRGNGINFIHPDGTGWVLRKDDTTFAGDIGEVVSELHRRIAGRMRYRHYLVQRYIPSLAIDGRPADFRIHVQKGGDGAWGVTRIYVRLAEAGMPLTNVNRGGYQGDLEGLLSQRKARPPAAIAAELDSLGLEAARTIEQAAETSLSELGIDVVLDRNDTLWLLEANAHPQTGRHEHERAVNTIAYAKHVAARARIKMPA